jgi:hypothetical protein
MLVQIPKKDLILKIVAAIIIIGGIIAFAVYFLKINKTENYANFVPTIKTVFNNTNNDQILQEENNKYSEIIFGKRLPQV